MSELPDSFIILIKDHKTVQHKTVQHKTVQHKADQTLLESLEGKSIEIQSHCRQGYCGACRTKLLCGQVKYQTDPLAYIDDDEILPCCCIPASNIEIKII